MGCICKALEARKALQGADHLEAVMLMECLAVLSIARGDNAAAKSVLLHVVEMRTAAPSRGPRHDDTLNALHRLAMAHQGLGETDEAERLYKQVRMRQHPQFLCKWSLRSPQML